MVFFHQIGDFEKRPTEKWAPGERAPVVKREDNLHPEGRIKKEKWVPDKRAYVVKRPDNLLINVLCH